MNSQREHRGTPGIFTPKRVWLPSRRTLVGGHGREGGHRPAHRAERVGMGRGLAGVRVEAVQVEVVESRALQDALHPAVLLLMQRIVEPAHRRGKRVADCGEVAADVPAALLVVGFGVDELSVNPRAIPATKAAMRATSLKDMQTSAAAVPQHATRSQQDRRSSNPWMLRVCLLCRSDVTNRKMLRAHVIHCRNPVATRSGYSVA
jgi:hypothetical protein